MIGTNGALALPMTGSLPPDLQGTLFRAGPARPWGSDDPGEGDERAGALHAVEIRDGRAVSYVRQESDADATVFWHAGSVLALSESGIPSQYSRLLEPKEFAGGLTVPIASHVHRLAADGGRILFGVDDGAVDGGEIADGGGIFLRLGEWDAAGALRSARSVELERATWQHDIGVTTEHVVFLESPTTGLPADHGGSPAVPFGSVPGAEGWIGVV
ncbi:MAG TPA: carotenoid oxygenase family protein, partial [Acidimicrobiales bacterium]|nr:carotenoid oxygenase family protein [Acidimicrobiales bacterium]